MSTDLPFSNFSKVKIAGANRMTLYVKSFLYFKNETDVLIRISSYLMMSDPTVKLREANF